MENKNLIEVAINAPLDRTFYYMVPEDLSTRAVIGMRVTVPFGRRAATGYIVGFPKKEEPDGSFELKEIKDIPDSEPVFNQDMLKLYRWISDYYMAPLGEVISTALPPIMKRIKKSQQSEAGRLELKKVEFTDAQKDAFSALVAAMDGGEFSPFLLHGVTGSGKTEVYLRVIEEFLTRGKGGIVLVPEISLTPQLLGRFRSRFGNAVASLHSAMSDGERYSEWMRIKKGDARIVVGARSAVFAPVNDLGVIVVDEEHDHSYKQEDSPRYNARDLALVRGKMVKGLVVLGSATPSLESYYNASTGKFRYLRLPSRVAERPMPVVQIMDMKNTGKRQILSSQMAEALDDCMRNKKQAILFLNRRGFSTLLICSDCGFTFGCPNCSISLIFHQEEGMLRCHYCDYSQKAFPVCPKCHGSNIGLLGHGTEKVEEEINKLFPEARTARMDRDTVSKKGSHARILKGMENGDLDILIGTQMVTKGHDYPGITLVGVISADTSLNFPDFRAGEKTFQLISQVAGRAGRGDDPGKVIIQTFNPDHYSIVSAAAHDMDGFYKEEMASRKELGYPPFTRLANLRIKGNSEKKVSDAADCLGAVGNEKARDYRGIVILGPTRAPLYKLRGKYRWHMLAKGKESGILHSFLKEVMSKIMEKREFKGIDLQVDVDPVNML